MHSEKRMIVFKVGTAALDIHNGKKIHTVLQLLKKQACALCSLPFTTYLGQGGGPNTQIVGAIADQIVIQMKEGHQALLVSSGAVGSGKTRLSNERLAHIEDPIEKKSLQAGVGECLLTATWINAFGKHNYDVIQSLLEGTHFGPDPKTIQGKFKILVGTLFKWPELLPNATVRKNLMNGLNTPQTIIKINENDFTATEELRLTDNDSLSSYVGIMTQAHILIAITNTDGVWNNPTDKETIPIIDFHDPSTWPKSTEGQSNEGKGGMALKIAAHRRFAENGGVCLILHAKDIDKIADILDNPRKTNPGTFLFDSSQSHKAPIENIVLALKARLQNQSPQDLTRGRPLSPLYVLKNPATETL